VERRLPGPAAARYLAEPHQRRRGLRLQGGRGHRALLRTLAQQQPKWYQKGQQHQRSVAATSRFSCARTPLTTVYSLWRVKAHAHAPHSVQVPGLLRGFLDFATQPGQVNVDGLLGAAVRLPPHLRE